MLHTEVPLHGVGIFDLRIHESLHLIERCWRWEGKDGATLKRIGCRAVGCRLTRRWIVQVLRQPLLNRRPGSLDILRHLLGAGQYANGRHQVHFDFHPWQSGIAELVEHGQLDLVLHIDDGLLPSHFQWERLYREDWICAVAHDSRFGDSLSLKQYLAANHIVVSTYAGVQTIPEKQLAAVGAKRNSCIRVPYFGVALQCLVGTELVLTLTSGLTSVVKRDRKLRLVRALQELHAFYFLMAWHSATQHRSSSCMASGGDTLDNRRAQWVRRKAPQSMFNSWPAKTIRLGTGSFAFQCATVNDLGAINRNVESASRDNK